MPVPLLVPILGAMAGTIAGPALGLGAAAAAGGAAAGGIGSLLAGAAPAALGAGIATLAAGGDPREALMNAALGGAGSVALPGVTSALQGLGGAGAQQAAVEAVRTPVQAASAAPAASLRPVARPDTLMAAAGPAGATPTSAAGGPGFMDRLAQTQKIMGMVSPGEQQQAPPMPTPQITGGQPQAAAGGSPFGSILGAQPQTTPTAMDYTGGQSFAVPPTGSMSMMPDSLNVGLGQLRPREQAMGPGFNMARGFV